MHLPEPAPRTFIESFFPVLDASGSVISVGATLTDITAQKQAEEAMAELNAALREEIAMRTQAEVAVRGRTEELIAVNADLARAARLKDEFMANMSHELRTPLYGVLSMAEAMLEEVYGPVNSRQASALEDIAVSGRHLMTLFNDILDVAKIDAGKLVYEPCPVNVAAVCASSIRLIKESAHKARLDVHLEVDPALDVIETDEKRLKQILVNLLSNAVKFTGAGGAIGLEAGGDPARGTIAWTVWDTGIGIQATDLARIFEPFTQVDSGLARHYSGTGLGLSLVRKMTGLLGGTVVVRSETGRGSRFTIELPWKKPDDATPRTLHDPLLDPVCDRSPADPAALSSHQWLSATLAECGFQFTVYPFTSDVWPRIRSLHPLLLLVRAAAGDPVLGQICTALAGDPDPRMRAVTIVLLSEDALPLEPPTRENVIRLGPPLTRESLLSALAPVLATTSAERLAIMLVPETSQDGPGPLVLLAEDNEVNARSVVDFLKNKGMRTALACDGEEAVSRAIELRPQVILMDIQMPGTDGFEAIRILKSNPGTRAIPIIALTALAMPGDQDRCLRAGADAYLSKPIVLRDVFEMVRGFLEPRQWGNQDDARDVFDQPDLDRG